ncbi:MAG: HAMP domain-containing histidine kinase [Acidobacteria bacterium]|nr:HAMP domain-containing histidine kinase [Acidobacteriota bacterium]
MKSPLHRVNSATNTWSLRNRLVLGVVVLGAMGFIASDFAAQSAFRSFLIAQVDKQLIDIAGGSLLRLDRAGIAQDQEVSSDETQPFKQVRPLSGVPTAISITLLDPAGVVVGTLGGDLSTNQFSGVVSNMTTADVISHEGKPYTMEMGKDDTHFRVLARTLPSGFGSVVAAVSLEDVDKTIARLRFLFLLIGLLALVAIALASRRIIDISLRPLTRIEETAEAIASGDLSARLPDAKPNTEVGRLVTSLNQMLSRIEESFALRLASEEKLRRFIADASHELRTPLTAIRGFAELHRQGAVQGEEKTAELVRRIEKESIRMSTLVEDLLLLARLDQARELQRDPVDVKTLINEVVASAQAAKNTHPITVSHADSDVYILGDSQRIHQVIANLIANAQSHTPDGTAVNIAVAQNKMGTTISVTDNGPGLSEADQVKVFERFYRADPSRVRSGLDGSGLGLSIVDAVMGAHGGSVSVKSELGKGATFTLFFPTVEM